MIISRKSKIDLNLLEAVQWGHRAKLSGERALEVVPLYHQYLFNLKIGDNQENPDFKLFTILETSLNADIYFFILSFANYIKALKVLSSEVGVEKFKSIQERVESLRNIKEHWQDNRLNNWMSGRIGQKARKNIETFLKYNQHSPAIPFTFGSELDGEISLAETIKIREVLGIIDANEIAIEHYRKVKLSTLEN